MSSVIFTSIKEMAKELMARFYDIKCELFIVIYFDENDNLVHSELVGVGDESKVEFSLREVMKFALVKEACKMILVHNHPLNIVKPSKQDVKLTKTVKRCCELLGIRLICHLIVGKSDYYVI